MNYFSFFLLLILSGAVGIPLLAGFSPEFEPYVVPGLSWIIALCHAISGLLLNTRAMRLSNNYFFYAVFGGIAIRMLGVAIAVVLLFPVIRDAAMTFILSLAFFYFTFQGAEIAFLLRLFRKKINR